MDPNSPSCFLYMSTDIPPAMTIAEYRRNRRRPRSRRGWFGLRRRYGVRFDSYASLFDAVPAAAG
jgi:hypothetical protein